MIDISRFCFEFDFRAVALLSNLSKVLVSQILILTTCFVKIVLILSKNKTRMALRSLLKLISNAGSVKHVNYYMLSSSLSARKLNVKTLRLYCRNSLIPKNITCNFNKTLPLALGLSLLSWLGFEKDDEDEESELIMTLKRSVLCMKREQYDKAEQMLHLALRLAQQQQNQQGVTYCYDLMANLAMDRFELDKAEKLFINVLQMLLGSGTEQDDLKVIHISLKLARISQLKADSEKANLGYNWCLEQIAKHKNDNIDAKMLNGVVHDWYAQFLLDKGDIKKALWHLQEAYKACRSTKGEISEQAMLLLNDLGTTSFRAGDLENAQSFLKEAINIGKAVEEKDHLGVVHANLGLILLEKGVTKEAERYCKEAWRLGNKHENNESVEQANYCFEQIKLSLGK